ncbi:MAG: peroxidase-related enzyme [Chloroflexota bacterium]|nr:peroxidase-related enzyme [Chloroflexota bacterium]
MTDPITDLTTVVPFWKPRVTPVELDKASEEQLEAMKVTPSDTGVGEYVLVLAHDPKTLKERTPLLNGIMYSHGGLSRTETELGAVAASLVNRCIYCAAVHSNRYNQLSKDETVIEGIFDSGEDADLDPRQQAIYNFATKLSQCPPEADGADLKQLTDAGLAMDEIFDLVLTASLFGWANRLMHVLGDPIPRES